MLPDDELMTVGEAQRYLEVNKVRMARYTREGFLTVYRKELGDRRLKWVRKTEVESLKRRLNEAKKLTPAA